MIAKKAKEKYFAEKRANENKNRFYGGKAVRKSK